MPRHVNQPDTWRQVLMVAIPKQVAADDLDEHRYLSFSNLHSALRTESVRARQVFVNMIDVPPHVNDMRLGFVVAVVAPMPPRFRNIPDETVKALAFCLVLLTACGGVAKSARCCPPRPSRRFAKRAMEQWVLLSQGTIAFLPPHVAEDCTNCLSFMCSCLLTWSSSRCFPSSWPDTATFRSCLCCHRDSLTRWRLALAREAARVASSLSSLLFF